MMICVEKLGKLILFERKLENESTKSKSQNFDQDSQRNHQVNEIEVSEIENHEKPRLN